MKDFESFVKTYSTRDFIYFFSQKSIEIYKEHIHSSIWLLSQNYKRDVTCVGYP